MVSRGVLPVFLFCLTGAASAWGQACTSVSLNNSGAFAAANGGNGTFNATGTPSNCLKSASSTVDWITISFGGGTANPSTFGYTVTANNSTQQRVGVIQVNGGLASFTVTQSGVTCSYNVSPSNATVGSAGTTNTFNVTTTSACSWTPVSNSAWIQVSGGSSGDGQVTYTVQANTTTEARSGTISVGSATFTVNQQPVCSFTLSPNFQQIRSGAESGTVTITANVSSCVRNAVSDSTWLTIPVGSSGTGNGTLSWSAAANPASTARTGRITIGDATFTVQQEGGSCSYLVAPASTTVPVTGGAGNFTLTTNCAWQARSSATWLSIVGPESGSGTATIGYSASGNSTPVARSASITVGDTAFIVSQPASTCSLTLNPTSFAIGPEGGAGAFGVDVLSGCNWTATSNASWLTIASAASGNADATITFNVAANTTPGTRTGVITVSDKTFTVTQQGANCTLSIEPASNLAVPSNAFQGTISVTSTCQWTAQSTVGFISITAGASGNGNGQVAYSVGANPSAQSRSGTIRIGNLTFNITQTGGGCSITLNPPQATISGAVFAGRFNINGSVGCQWTPSTTDSWITIASFSSVNGSGAVDYTLTPNFTGAERTGTVRVNNETFSITQGTSKPSIVANGILNAASFRGGPVAAGEIVTIYGTLMGPAEIKTLELTSDRTGITTELARTRVLFDDVPAPIIYTTDKQLSCIVPFEVQGKPSVKVKVEYRGAQSDAVDIPVAQTAPAIFTQNANGTGLAAILNQDNSLNGTANAAARNSIIQIFATGGGQTNPAGQTGKLTGTPLPQFPAGRIIVRINNIDAPVVYAGGAPGLVQGLIQINVRVPATAPIGPAVPILIRANNVDSPAGVTVAIRQ